MGKITKSKSISKIITNALITLKMGGMDDLSSIVMKHDYFITNIEGRAPCNKGYQVVIIDLTRKMHPNPMEFEEHSRYLYNKFAEIRYWYSC